MARVKLDLPDAFEFTTEIQVRIGDINYGGHLGNDAVLSLVHEARVRFLQKYGFTEANIDGVGLIMTDAIIVYKSEGFYGDTLTIDVAVGDFGRSSCDFFYRLTNKHANKEVARAKTGVVFIDYHTRKIVEIPPKFKAVLNITH